jgi:cell division protein FtsW (lipid II flippase)
VLGIAAIAAVFAIDELLKYPTSDGTYEYVLLKQYQRSRLFVFMNQDSLSTTDDGYNLQQAMIAIGSGGLLGKGLGAGAQSALGFLPEAPTDFIFCVLAEDLGFVGVVFLLVLYLALLIICIGIAKKIFKFVWNAYSLRYRWNVDIPNTRKHWDVLRIDANYGNSVAVCELWIILHGGEFCDVGVDSLGSRT